MVGAARGWTAATESGRRGSTGADGVADGNVGTELPRLDSLLQEGEEDEAKTTAAMASSGVVGNGGMVRPPGAGDAAA